VRLSLEQKKEWCFAIPEVNHHGERSTTWSWRRWRDRNSDEWFDILRQTRSLGPVKGIGNGWSRWIDWCPDNPRGFLKGPMQSVALRTTNESDTVYIRRLKTMNVLFEFSTVWKSTKETALLDSGATENFLDEEVWKQLQIGRTKLPKSLTVHNVDGTENWTEKINFYCWLKVIHQKQVARMKFYLTGLGGDCFILEYPFLYFFNPDVDWRGAKLWEGAVQLETIRFHEVENHVARCQCEVCTRAGLLAEGEEIRVHRTTMAQQWARDSQKEKRENVLLTEYERHRAVFDEEKAKRFPPKREGELEIPLMPDVPKVRLQGIPTYQRRKRFTADIFSGRGGKGVYLPRKLSIYRPSLFH